MFTIALGVVLGLGLFSVVVAVLMYIVGRIVNDDNPHSRLRDLRYEPTKTDRDYELLMFDRNQE